MIFGDYHVHSRYSKDAKSTIEENVQMAVRKGLKQLAITDHAFYHKYGITLKKLEKIKQEVEELNQKYPIRVLVGLEANLISQNGEIDVPIDVQNDLDMLVLGCHKSCKFFNKPAPFVNFFKHLKIRLTSKKQIEKNTQAYINAIKKNNINILAHLNYACKVNVEEVGKVAKENNVMIELNGRKNLLKRDEIKKLVDMKCLFVLNSDAHSCENVADFHKCINIVEKNNIPEELIVNFNKTPVFVKRIAKL